MTRKVILDVDTGTDDAVAIMLAALHPDIELIGVTTVSGNVEVEYCTDNTLRVLDHIGKSEIPVYEGAVKPIARPDFPIPRSDEDIASQIHGKSLPIPEASNKKADKHAVEYLIETFRVATEPITLVPTAPLTNIATAITLDPKFVENVPEVVLMGGSHHVGNVTASAEFNIWADPEAASVVFAAGFKNLTMVPLDATHIAYVNREDCERMANLKTPAGEAAAKFTLHRIDVEESLNLMKHKGTTPVHDALCIAYLVDKDILSLSSHQVAVETHGEHTVGRTVIDTRAVSRGHSNCQIAFDANREKFVEILVKTFSLQN